MLLMDTTLILVAFLRAWRGDRLWPSLDRLPGVRRPLDERARFRGRGVVVPASLMSRLSVFMAESAGPASAMGVTGGPLSRGAERTMSYPR